jgi:transcription elongation factor SPT6
MGITNEYYKMEIWWKIDSVEMVSDAIEWLGLKYKNSSKNWDHFELYFHDNED